MTQVRGYAHTFLFAKCGLADMKQSEHIHPHSMTSFVHDSRLSASLGNLLYDCDGMGDGRTGNQVAVCEVIVSILVAFALLTTILAALLLPPLVLVYCTAMILPARRRKTALNLPTADHDTSSARGNARHGLSTTEQSSPTRRFLSKVLICQRQRAMIFQF